MEKRKLVKISLNESVVFQFKQAEEIGSFSYMVLAIEINIEEVGYKFFLMTKKSH